MKNIKTVGIKKLKDQLSSYLRDVQSGTVVFITDRDRVIAELHEPTYEIAYYKERSVLTEWVRTGKLIQPKTKKNKCKVSPVKVKNGTVQYLLDQDRMDE